MPFFQLSGAFLARRDFENITFDFVWIFPIYVTKNFHKIKTSVKKFSKVFLKIYWNFKKVVFYLLEKNHCTQYGPEKVTFIFFGQNTCHVLELCEKINWISLKAFLWHPLQKRQYFLRWCNFYDEWYCTWRTQAKICYLVCCLQVRTFLEEIPWPSSLPFCIQLLLNPVLEISMIYFSDSDQVNHKNSDSAPFGSGFRFRMRSDSDMSQN